MRARLAAATVAVAALGAGAPAAQAADPGLWTETGRSTIPLQYYQGVAADPAKRLFFDGIHVGLYRTDALLNETARNDDVIPPAVHASEQYNHIGDIEWDAREGGRILLPLECYYPQAAPGQEDENNTCMTGSIGVADPNTLQWRYYVKLDPAEIPKAMWTTVSPDGELLWTQSGRDLLAYDMDDISPANAAPTAQPIKAVRRLANARPPSGITGAVFYKGRLFVAGQDNPDGFQVWSIDVSTGERRLEIERQIVGESEGLAIFESLGGVLHWMIQPFNTEGPPTYGPNNGTILHFVPRGETPTTRVARPAKVRLTVKPRHVRRGRRVTFSFRASAMIAGRLERARDVKIRFAGKRATTDALGRATIRATLPRAGLHTARGTRRGLRPGTRKVRARP